MLGSHGRISSGKLDYIDALRGTAALFIVVYHLSLLKIPDLLLDPIMFTQHSVILFFIISSFTLYLSMDNRQDEEGRFLMFYLRRFFRIAPLFYSMIIFYIFANYLIYDHIPSVIELFSNIFFLFNFSASYFESIVWTGWSIGVEMIFYLLMPLIFLVVNTIRRSVIFIAFTIGFRDLFKMIFPEVLVDKYSHESFITNFPVFAIGISCYLVYKYYIPRVNGSYRSAVSMLLFLPSAILFCLMATNRLPFLIPSRPIPWNCWYALAFGLLLLSLSLYQNKLLVNRVTRFYGNISYSVYLVHPVLVYSLGPAYHFVYDHANIPDALNFCLCLLLTLAVVTPIAFLTYHLIETPGIRYGKRLIARL